MMILRALILGLGALLILGGFAAIAVGGWVGLWGLWLVVGGLVIIAAIEPRFSPTTERFVDPTTGVTMVVWVDKASGDRRYRADR